MQGLEQCDLSVRCSSIMYGKQIGIRNAKVLLPRQGSRHPFFEGAVLSGDDQAIREAPQAARETLAEKIVFGDIISHTSFEVVRADGHLIAVIPVSSVLRFQ